MDGLQRADVRQGGAATHRKPSASQRRIDPRTDGSSIASRGGCPMRRSLRFAIATALLAGLVLGTGSVAAANRGHHKILDVQLVGLAVPRTVIAGFAGAGHAWAIDEGNAKLFSDGRLLINVEGLVLTPEGTNPVTSGKGVVSCNGGATAADIV